MDMNRIFDPENPFWMFMSKIADVLCISLLWLLFSIPVVTIGASTTALFQFTLKQSANEEGYVWHTFFNAFKKNFKQATIIWIPALLLGILLIVEAYVCLAVGTPFSNMLFFAFMLLGIIYILILMWVFPIIALFELSTKKAVGNAFVMAVGNLHVSITIAVIAAALIWVFQHVPILSVFGMGFFAFFSSYFFRSVFRRYMDAEENGSKEQ